MAPKTDSLYLITQLVLGERTTQLSQPENCSASSFEGLDEHEYLINTD